MATTWNPVMVDTTGGNGKRRLFEPTFTMGNGLTLLTLVLGGVFTISQIQTNAARQEERSGAFERQVATLSLNVDKINDLIVLRAATRYSRPDAEHDFAEVYKRLDAHERRFETLETRIRNQP